MSESHDYASYSSETDELLQRVRHVEENITALLERAKTLREQVESAREDRRGPSPSDRFVSDLARLEHFLLRQFPQLIKHLEEDLAVVIPGLTGCGEVGPGGVQFPNNDGGGTLERDFYKRGFR